MLRVAIENAEFPVKFEFQINNECCLGCTYTKKLYVVIKVIRLSVIT
jgi:hypothetical protein